MKTLSLFLCLMLLSGCGGAPFTGEFTQSGTAAGDAGATGDIGQAGDPDLGEAGAGPSPATAGAPSASAGASPGGAPSAGGDAAVAGAPSAGAPATPPITPPCDDATVVDISDHYFSGLTADAACYRTREAFNTLRFVAGNPDRDVRVNGSAVMHCSSEPSDAWSNVCTLKGDFSGADVDGYRYIQVGAQMYGSGPLIWASEPDGEPCTAIAFAYSKAASYIASDRVTASCESGSGTCEWRCMSDSCSGVSTPKTPKWELVKTCEGT